jgi:hypothetical protein
MVVVHDTKGQRREEDPTGLEARYQRASVPYRAWQAHVARLRALVPKAVAALDEALDDRGDPKQRTTVALAILRAVGLWGLEPPRRPERLELVYDEELGMEVEEDASFPTGEG